MSSHASSAGSEAEDEDFDIIIEEDEAGGAPETLQQVVDTGDKQMTTGVVEEHHHAPEEVDVSIEWEEGGNVETAATECPGVVEDGVLGDAGILTVEEEELLLQEAECEGFQPLENENEYENNRDENEDGDDDDEEDDDEAGEDQDDQEDQSNVSGTHAASGSLNDQDGGTGVEDAMKDEAPGSSGKEGNVRRRKRRRSGISMPMKRKKKASDDPTAACRSAEEIARRRLDEISAAELASIMSSENSGTTGLQKRRGNMLKLAHPRVNEFPYWGDIKAYILGHLMIVCKKKEKGRNLYHSERYRWHEDTCLFGLVGSAAVGCKKYN
jgi:hypothetical protein